MPQAAGIVAAVAAVVGTAASLKQASDAREAAREAERQAQLQAEWEAERQAQATRKLLGQQRARFAASGVTLEGTPFEVLEETEQEAADERAKILQLGGLEASIIGSEGRRIAGQHVGTAITTGLQGTATLLEGMPKTQPTPTTGSTNLLGYQDFGGAFS